MPKADLIPMRTIRMAYQAGGSDKIYNITPRAKDGGWVLDVERGARLGARVNETRPEVGVFTEAQATKLFTELVNKRLKHRDTPYTEDTEGGERATPEPAAAPQSERVGCVLLTAVDANQGAALISNPDYAAEQKHDGKRIILIGTSAGVTAYNRSGLACGISPLVLQHAQTLQRSVQSFAVDGEMIGETYYVFELLELAGTDYREHSYETRKKILKRLIELAPELTTFVYGYVAWTIEQKRELLTRMYAAGAEGLVFRQVAALYRTGRQPREFKLKFWESATCIVSELNPTKSSVSIQLYNEANELVDVGHCTVDYRKKGLSVGDLVEIKYLYFNQGGSLYQTSYLGKRDDIPVTDCNLSQLRVKNAQMVA